MPHANDNLQPITQWLYPQGTNLVDWVVQKDGPDLSPYYASWTLAGVTQPTVAYVMGFEAQWQALSFGPLVYITYSLTLDSSHSTVLCSTASSPITITLPVASSAQGQKYTIKKTSVDVNTVAITPLSGDQIDNNGISAPVYLYVQTDFLTIVARGSLWYIIADGRCAHCAKMVRQTPTAVQSVTGGTNTKALFGGIVFDVGGLPDLALSRFVIRRAGRYGIHCAWQPGSSSMSLLQCFIYLNGSAQANSLGATTGSFYSSECAAVLSLAAGDVIEFYMSSNTTVNTINTVGQVPRMEIWEIRP